MSDAFKPETAAAYDELENTLMLAEQYAEEGNCISKNLQSHAAAISEDLAILMSFKASDPELAKCNIDIERKARRVRRELERLANLIEEQKLEIRPTQEARVMQPARISTEVRQTLDDKLIDDAENQAKMKLPTCKLPIFSGDPAKFATFYDTFMQTVANNPAVPVAAKWLYLLDSLGGNALMLVKELPQRKSTLDVALKMLYDAYGDDGRAVTDAHQRIQFLPAAKDNNESLRLTYAQLEGMLLTLEDAGQDTDANLFLRSVYIGKFPKEVIYFTVKKDDTLKTIRHSINEYILSRESTMRIYIDQSSTPTNVQQVQTNTLEAPQQAKISARADRPPQRRANKPPLRCLFCPEQHWPDECTKICTASERQKAIPERCTRCIRELHPGTACAVIRRCVYCYSMEHNRALCPRQFPDKAKTLTLNERKEGPRPEGTFWTLMVEAYVEDRRQAAELRMLLDPGSARSFITSSAAKSIGLPVTTGRLTCITSADDAFVDLVPAAEKTITVATQFGTYEGLNVLVIPKIVDDVAGADLQTIKIDYSAIRTKYIPEAGNGKPVDILVGNDHLISLLELEKSQKVNERIQLLATKLGWILLKARRGDNPPAISILSLMANDEIKRMWDLEALGLKYVEKSDLEEEEKAIQAFYKNIKYINKRYEVTWPWREFPPAINENLGVAIGRLRSLWRQLHNKPEILRNYHDIITQQIQLGIVEETARISKAAVTRYIPHHPIICPEKSTKIRPVYDASARSGKTDRSLNDCLLKGKKWLEDLPAMLLRFRKSGIAVVGDIEKAYHQISIAPNDRDAVRFLWLRDVNKPPTDENLVFLRFCRMAFGIVSSPFLLYATITYHLQRTNTQIAQIISQNMYADNLVAVLPQSIQPQEFYEITKNIFAQMSMNLTKWATNDMELREKIPLYDRHIEYAQPLLGLCWLTETDRIALKRPKSAATQKNLTKRTVLSQLAAAFDPLGWAAPVTLTAKKFIRKLWEKESKWDEKINPQLNAEWDEIAENLRKIDEINLPRQMFQQTNENDELEMHVFSDASGEALAMVAYAVKRVDDGKQLAFLAAKTKLAPKNKLSIPRLELLAAVLAARFAAYLKRSLKWHTDVITYLWSDSTCVLSWIMSEKIKPTIIDRQVAEIRNIKIDKYMYVPTEINPADVASRGATIEQLQQMNWWQSPNWLLYEKTWPQQKLLSEAITSQEDKLLFIAEQGSETEKRELKYQEGLMGINEKKFSSLSRLLRVTAACLRALNAILKRQIVVLDDAEISVAKLYWIRNDQQRRYPEYHILEENKTKFIRNLRVFRDTEGIIRCQTRLQHSGLHQDAISPILLMNGSHITTLLILKIHSDNKHVNAPHVLSILRHTYCLPKGRREISAVIRKHCLVCRKYLTQTYSNPPPAPLPEFRVTRGKRPFTATGLDVFGPFSVRTSRDKKAAKTKKWVMIFTCTVIRAVHLEVLNGLTTIDIVEALRRFAARRGAPQIIVCDNAPQFHVLDGRFLNIWREIKKSPELNSYLTQKEIQFKFVPQHSPWMGGVYERLIKDIKIALEKTYGTSSLMEQQFVTSICEVEAVINDRPLVYLEKDDATPLLTPNHFLAAHFTAIELADPQRHANDPIAVLWRTSRTYLDSFWAIWSEYYLLSLRDRDDKLAAKHHNSKAQPKVGELVLIAESSKSRSSWKMARILRLISSADGIVRSALLRLPNNVKIIRPIIKIAPLQVGSGDSVYVPAQLSADRRNLIHPAPEGADGGSGDADPQSVEVITVFPDEVDRESAQNDD